MNAKINLDDKRIKAVEWGALLLLTVFSAWLHFYKLGELGLWGDEGFTYLAVEGLLKHGAPMLPSGNYYFRDLLFSYFTAIPCSVWGLTEGALRSVNALFAVALVPVFYLVGRRYFPSPLVILGAIFLTLSPWEIVFGREARYYCQLQFFFLLALHFFYLGFVQNIKKHQKWAFLFFVLATLTHQLAYSLILSFFVLVLVRGPYVVKDKRPLLFFCLFIAWMGVLEFLEHFLYREWAVIDLTGGKRVWGDYFSNFRWGYFLEFYWLFPKMSWVAALGALFALLWRKQEPLCFMVGMGLLCLLLMEIGHVHLQPRYVFYLYPVFIFAFLGGLWGIFRLGKRFCFLLRLPFGRILGLVMLLGVLAKSAEAYHPGFAVTIPSFQYGKGLMTKFQVSTTIHSRIDYKTTGEYVRRREAKGDIIVGMHMIYASIYAGRCDYWLWSAGPGTWDAYHEVNGKRIDRYLGIPVVPTLAQFKELLKNSKEKRVWVVVTPSIEEKGHIHPEIAAFLKSQPQKVVYNSPDGMSRVYLFDL